MDDRSRLAADSRDGHLAVRRVERHQLMIERLVAARGERITVAGLAHDLDVSERTVARDVERLALSGVPLQTRPGRGGGVSLPSAGRPAPITFDLAEAAALMSSLAVLGPSVTPHATSAMQKLATAVAPRSDE